jgi:hypothetical protein
VKDCAICARTGSGRSRLRLREDDTAVGDPADEASIDIMDCIDIRKGTGMAAVRRRRVNAIRHALPLPGSG